MTFVARKVGLRGHMILVTNRLGGLRIFLLVEMAGLAATQVDLTMLGGFRSTRGHPNAKTCEKRTAVTTTAVEFRVSVRPKLRGNVPVTRKTECWVVCDVTLQAACARTAKPRK